MPTLADLYGPEVSSLRGGERSDGLTLADIAKGARDVGVSLWNMATLPARQMQPNPYPAGTEEAQWYADNNSRQAYNWGPEMAINMIGVGGPAAMVGPANAIGSAGGKGIKAYHGSPHDFDRFDLSKIGTGEGAQAYGHGLYFAEAEGTAKSYRDALAGKGLDLKGTVARHLPDGPLDQQALGRIYSASFHGGADPVRAAKTVQWAVPELRDAGGAAGGPVGEKIARAIEDIRNQHKGRMYEVNINAHPDQFLDWDKPIKSQPQNVRSGLSPFIQKDVDMIERSRLSGQEKNDRISDLLEGNLRGGEYYNWQAYRPKTSEAMRDAGIPGIKYLDQGSRVNVNLNDAVSQLPSGKWQVMPHWQEKHPELAKPFATAKDAQTALEAAVDKGTRNYVVFDDKLIDILRKYGIALPSAPAGVAMTQNDAQAAQ